MESNDKTSYFRNLIGEEKSSKNESQNWEPKSLHCAVWSNVWPFEHPDSIQKQTSSKALVLSFFSSLLLPPAGAYILKTQIKETE